MTDLFPFAVAIVLEAEGVFSNDKQDPGGATYYGIARMSHPNIPWPPTKEQAISIYRTEYWDKHRCGEMPWAWALAVFDGAVNQGAVVRTAQFVLGLVVDGAVGDQTIKAMQNASVELLNLFFADRAKMYVGSALFSVYGTGWLKRLFGMRANCVNVPT